MTFKIGDVPCNGCTLCCHNDAVRLLPGDNPSQYFTEPHPYFHDERMLAHSESRDCIYMKESGCSIHSTRPQQCREMDCRVMAQRISLAEARFMDILPVWRRGRELLNKGSEDHVA